MKRQVIKSKHGTIIADTDYAPPKKKNPVGRPVGAMTPSRARKEIDALTSLLEDGDLDMKTFHRLKDAILEKLTEGK